MTRGARAAAAVAIVAAAFAATVAPVWTYAVTLAVCGLPHALVELRYVDERFASRTPGRVLAALGVVLVAIAAVRFAGLLGVGSVGVRAAVELGLGIGLVGIVLPLIAHRARGASGVGVAVVALFAYGVVVAPLTTLVVFAFVHNLTPLGFVVERVGRALANPDRVLLATAFVLVPLAIASGVVSDALAAFVGDGWLDGPDGVGGIEAQIGAFVPEPWWRAPLAVEVFRAGAFLQCMHYAVVLGVLPRLGGGAAQPGAWLRWPAPRRFVGFVAGGALLAAIGFALSFGETRASYGVLAAVHAWIEIPVLLLALGVPAAPAGSAA